MYVNSRWVSVAGELRIMVTLPNGQYVTITQADAQELVSDLQRTLMAPPPTAASTE